MFSRSRDVMFLPFAVQPGAYHAGGLVGKEKESELLHSLALALGLVVVQQGPSQNRVEHRGFLHRLLAHVTT